MIDVLEHQRRVRLGIALTLLSYFFFSCHDAVIKELVATQSVVAILFVRGCFIFCFAVALGRGRVLRRAVATPLKRALLLRAAIILVAWLMFYSSGRYLQLAEMTTLYFATPVLVTLLAAPMLKETVTSVRWFAVILGFVGVVIACRPGSDLDPLPVALALGAAVLWAFSFILMRSVAKKEETLIQMLYGNGFITLACGGALFWFAHWPTERELALMLLVGAIGAAAQYTLFEGVKRAPASLLAPFEYCGLIFAFVLGYLLWGDVPHPAVFIGAGFILFAGFLAIWGERRAQAASNTA